MRNWPTISSTPLVRLLGGGFRYSRGAPRRARRLPLGWGAREAPAAGAGTRD